MKLTHKDFVGIYDFDEETEIYQGEVQNVCGVVFFEGKTEEDVAADFRQAVDVYTALCKSDPEPTEQSG